MTNSRAISIRIPDELLEKIDRLAEEKYKSHKGTPNRSLVILDAIVAYFDTLSDTSDIVLVSDSVSIVEFNGLRDIVSTLSNNIKQLENNIIALSDSDNLSINEDVKLKENEPEQNQLSIISVSDNVSKNLQDIDSGLTPAQLAERLGKAYMDITSKKSKTKADPDKFTEWSKKLDPDGWGWEFREEKGNRGKYFPIKPLA
jgi:metal-responsive CopG/Arc/MetJ family transcriptional regulator